jgi:hypothetical protein
MGSLAEAFRENGNSGHTYRLARRGEGIGVDDLDSVRFYAMWRGHTAIAGAIEPNPTEGDTGLIKFNPELSPDELQEIHEAGFSTESHPAL